MYGKNVDTDNFNVSLDGYEMIMEELTPNESYNRRETIRHNIIGGTQSVMRGNYLPRDYSFTTHVLIDPDFPDVYDSVFREWQSKPVEVISKHMGGKFNAEVIIKKSPSSSPNYLGLEVQVIEIPNVKSLIPNEEIVVPSTKVNSVKVSSSTNKSTGKGKDATSTKGGKRSSKSSSKSNRKSSKGKNVTKVKKND